jgi:hypothetical protein
MRSKRLTVTASDDEGLNPRPGINQRSPTALRHEFGKRIAGGSSDSHIQSEARPRTVDYVTIPVNIQKEAPTIQATIAGQERILPLDTGSSICLVLPGVQLGTVRTPNMSAIRVTGDSTPRSRNTGQVRLKPGRFNHRFYVSSLPRGRRHPRI